MSHTIITGAPVPTGLAPGQPPARREINDLVQDDVQFSLYVQALSTPNDNFPGIIY